MKRILSLGLLLYLSVFQASAQKVIDVSKSNQCTNPYALSTAEVNGPFGQPSESGIEIFGRKEYAAWFKMLITQDGKLIFDIVPGDSADNYDFQLYKYDQSPDFCSKIKANILKPIRSNFYGSDLQVKGRTGLSVLGNGKTYNKAISVKNGETFYLKLSNLLAERSGNLFVVFNYLKTYHLKGNISSVEEAGRNIKDVQLSCLDTRNSEFIGKTSTDKTGGYDLEIGVKDKAHEFPFYDFTIYHPKYLIFDTVVSSTGLLNLISKPLDIKLVKLKKNMKYPEVIFFSPNSPNSLVEPESYQTLRKIYKLLSLNKDVTINLEGHSNGFYPSTEIDQRLSEGRAQAVKDYLIKQGISPKRIRIHGNGCKKMLFPYPLNEKEEGYNRRVEIFINKIK